MLPAMVLCLFGRVLFYMDTTEKILEIKVPFTKGSLSFRAQAELLLQRGLVCNDKEQLIDSLRHYNYYRLSGYCLSFEQSRHQFLPGVTFEDLAAAYEFDRKLRKIVMESLELIEIQLRTSVAYQLAEGYEPFAHEKRAYLHIGEEEFKKWLELIHSTAIDSKEIFVRHFKKKYTDFPRLPIWILVEILSFGALSHLFSYLKKVDQKIISKQFGIPLTIFQNWLHHFAYLRNICAHHSRLFDKTFSIKPRSFHSDPKDFPPGKIVFSLLTIRSILRAQCFPQPVVREWRRKIEDLFANPPHINNFYEVVGSPVLGDAWLDSSFWK